VNSEAQAFRRTREGCVDGGRRGRRVGIEDDRVVRDELRFLTVELLVEEGVVVEVHTGVWPRGRRTAGGTQRAPRRHGRGPAWCRTLARRRGCRCSCQTLARRRGRRCRLSM
jgi:hypothetical protein